MSPRSEGQVPRVEAVELPLPRFQEQIIDWLELGQRRHAVHSLLEVDVSAARASIRSFRVRSGAPLSFTAYLVGCLARAIDRDRRIAAIRHGRRRMLVFDEVDVALPVESDIEDEAIPVPHIIRGADRKSLTEISREIRAGSRGPAPYGVVRRYLPAWPLLPAWLRRRMLALILADARRSKRAHRDGAGHVRRSARQGPCLGHPQRHALPRLAPRRRPAPRRRRSRDRGADADLRP